MVVHEPHAIGIYGATAPSTYIFSLPQGKLVGVLNVAGSLCSDDDGNVWIAGYPNGSGMKLAEYAHGGVKPVKILHVPHMVPDACAVDPASGDLAAAGGGRNYYSNVDIYPSGSSHPQTFVDKKFSRGSLTYDGGGNLFVIEQRVDAHRERGLEVAELPKGTTKFQKLRGSYINLGGTSGLKWDGKYLTIGDSLNEGGHELFHFVVRDNRLRSRGFVGIGGNFQYLAHYWIQGSKAAATSYCGSFNTCAPIYLFDYPAGGNPIKTIGQGIVPAEDGLVTISVARK